MGSSTLIAQQQRSRPGGSHDQQNDEDRGGGLHTPAGDGEHPCGRGGADGNGRGLVFPRLSLGADQHELPLRQGRAIAWFSEALEPLRGELGDDAVNDLALALRSVCGIETRVWLGEIAGLGPGGIRALQLWMTRALVARRLTSHRADGGPGEADLRSSHHRYLTDVSDTIGSWRGRAEPRAHPSCRSKLLGQTDNMTLRVGDERK